MISSSSDPPQEPLQIIQDTKFFNKLLSKDTSLANPSFRVYYGVASGAVPFLWESQPGTPKHSIHTPTLPPLTPPPSYHSNLHNKKHSKKHSKQNTLISSILPRLSLRKSHAPPSPPSSFSSSSVSSSSSSFSPSRSHDRSRRSSTDDEEDSFHSSPGSGLFGGCYSMVLMKNALLSMVGHGSNQGTTA
ncbi:hypothetical protein J5N97_014705 [Dioscorea zingiberensis]|uniref:Uncharacterized protein n=1 Tax=Dioscorea zingiberensis TaxID=325984 RepID=A0A9D5HJZ1_9LILI|nr:hypothetical protein J5N97_014705 [Dioscorea zingiberensis]